MTGALQRYEDLTLDRVLCTSREVTGILATEMSDKTETPPSNAAKAIATGSITDNDEQHHDEQNDRAALSKKPESSTSSVIPAKRNACTKPLTLIPDIARTSIAPRSPLIHTSFSVTELMSPTSPTKPKPTPTPSKANSLPQNLWLSHGTSGLGYYHSLATEPTSSIPPNPSTPSLILHATPHTLLIRDIYPKSKLHLLLLPRDKSKWFLHPFDAFSDTEDGRAFLSLMKTELERATGFAAEEMRRRYGHLSQSEKERRDALDVALRASVSPSPEPKSTEDSSTRTTSPPLPEGRNYTLTLKSGLHATPSMAHLHIHILSIEHTSPSLKIPKHYNSFTTPFLVPLTRFPIPPDDRIRDGTYQIECLSAELKCWRCGMTGFGKGVGGVRKLKGHLEGEFEEWIRE